MKTNPARAQRRTQSAAVIVVLVTGLLLSVGCGIVHNHRVQVLKAGPPASAKQIPGEATSAVVNVARDLVGAPYRYGGASPAGFDCSGFVFYCFRKVGVFVPRSSQEQYLGSRRVSVEQLRPGDVLFFRIERKRNVSHVGISAGSKEFIHAPSSGRRVSYANLDDSYWRKRLVGARRF
jgi:cell wall-associated NlpC family hydrolase